MAAIAETRVAQVTLRAASFDDYAGISRLEARYGLETKPYEEWRDLWRGNPVYERSPGWPIGWVAENEESEIVGYLGNIPFSYHFQGREIVAATGRGLVVQPRYRGYAASFLRRLLSQELADLTVIASANANSFKLFEPLRCSRVPAGNWNRSAFWVTGYGGFARSVMENKGWPQSLTHPAAAALFLRDHTERLFSRQKHRNRVGTCTSFDVRFDVFWAELLRTHPDRLLGTRTSDVLRWHFKHALAQDRVWVATIEKAGRLQAYALFYRHDSPQIGLKRMRLVDFQVLNDDWGLLAPMLLWARNRCQEEDIHMLEAFGFRPEKQRVIDSMGPHHRELPAWAFFYMTRNEDLARDLRNPSVWDPSHFDGDASL